jgi:hypothetical protein
MISVGAIIGLVSLPANAALIASDNAANSTYTVNSSFNGLNGGSGFGAWSVTIANPASTSSAGNFVASKGAGSGNAVLPNNTPVFDIFNNGNPAGNGSTTAINSSITTADRPFTGALVPGQAFSFVEDLGNGTGGSSNAEGWELLDASNSVLLNMFTNESLSGTNAGTTAYTVVDATGTFNPSAGNFGRNNSAADSFTFTLNDATGDYTVVSTGHSGRTFTGQIDLSTGGPTQFAFYDNSGGNSSDVQVTNLAITNVPEPGILVLGACSALALIRRRAL